MVIFFGNIIIEIIVRTGGSFTRPVNEQKIVTQTIRAISWIQFIDLGIVLFVLNMSIDFGIRLPDGMFQGDYEDFSSMWYIDVGY